MGVPFVALMATLAVVFFVRSERDAVCGLIAYATFLFVIPARFVLPGAGAAGTPAVVMGLVLLVWWLVSKALPEPVIADGPQPVRTVALAYAGWILISYAFSMRRELSTIELPGADRAALTVMSLMGVTLVAADGIRDRRRLDTMVAWLVGLGAVVAFIGLIQFFTPIDPVSYIRIPGLELTRELTGVGERAGLNRPASTALHPIEFGVVMAMLLPLALYRSSLPTPGAARRAWWRGCTICIAAAVPITVSRSAIIATIVAMVIYGVSLRGRSRVNLVAVAVLGVIAARAMVPGLVGTLSNLFLQSGSDSSVQARLSDVDPVLEMLSQHPVLGFGPGTLTVDEYVLLDNEYYMTALAAGLPGLVLLMVMVCTGNLVARRAVRGADEVTRRLGFALAGAFTAGGVALATFDGFSFRIFTGLFFLLLGCIGALWRIQRGGSLPERTGAVTSERPQPASSVPEI